MKTSVLTLGFSLSCINKDLCVIDSVFQKKKSVIDVTKMNENHILSKDSSFVSKHFYLTS